MNQRISQNRLKIVKTKISVLNAYCHDCDHSLYWFAVLAAALTICWLTDDVTYSHYMLT